MVGDRVEVRLDGDRHRKLRRMAHVRNRAMSEVIRSLIDRGYDELLTEERLAAVQRMAARNLEDVPDPESLRKQFDETYDLAGPD